MVLTIIEAALALEALHKQVLPFLLRRLKEDVLHDLPPKIIQDYYCELSELQKFLYDDFSRSRAKTAVEDVVRSNKEKDGEQQHVFQSLQYLRKLCNHPALVLKNDKEAIKDALTKSGAGAPASKLSDIQHAPKLQALRYVLYVSSHTSVADSSPPVNYLWTAASASRPDQQGTRPSPSCSKPKRHQQARSRSTACSSSAR